MAGSNQSCGEWASYLISTEEEISDPAILKRWENEQWKSLLDRSDLHEQTIHSMLKRKGDQLALEAVKRIKLDQQNKELMKENEVLKDTVNILTQDTTRRSKSRKKWTSYSVKQQQRKRQ